MHVLMLCQNFELIPIIVQCKIFRALYVEICDNFKNTIHDNQFDINQDSR